MHPQPYLPALSRYPMPRRYAFGCFLFACVIAGLTLGGCASPPRVPAPTTFVSAPDPPRDRVLIYLFWPKQPGITAKSMTVTVSSKTIELGPDQYVALYARPGKYLVSGTVVSGVITTDKINAPLPSFEFQVQEQRTGYLYFAFHVADTAHDSNVPILAGTHFLGFAGYKWTTYEERSRSWRFVTDPDAWVDQLRRLSPASPKSYEIEPSAP